MAYQELLKCSTINESGGVDAILNSVNNNTNQKITRLVAVGASITEDAFEDPVLNEIALESHGLSGLRIIEEGVSGNTTADILARLPSIIAENAGNEAFYAVLAMGNDVTNNRPFSSMTDLKKYELGNSYQQIVDLLVDSGQPFMLGNISYRNYDDVPPESNGSLPFNDSIVNTAIKTYCPDFWDFTTDKPLYNMYDLFKENTDFLLPDGIHPTEEGRAAIRDLILGITSRFFTVDKTGEQVFSAGNSVVIDFSATPAVQSNPAINTIETTDSSVVVSNTYGIGGLIVEVDPTWDHGDQGRGNSGNTSSTWENNDALTSYFFANDATDRKTIIKGGQAGATGTLYYSASRASDDGKRLIDVTYDGVTKTHDAGANPPEAISFDVTFDSNGEIEFNTKRTDIPDAAFCYMGVVQLDFT